MTWGACRRRARETTRTGSDVVVLPYNPFMWGRWGFAPRLVRGHRRIREARRETEGRARGPRAVRPIRGENRWRWASGSGPSLARCCCSADRRFASIERWARRSAGSARPGTCRPARTSPTSADGGRRRELSSISGTPSSRALSTGHPSHLTELRRGGPRGELDAGARSGLSPARSRLGGDRRSPAGSGYFARRDAPGRETRRARRVRLTLSRPVRRRRLDAAEEPHRRAVRGGRRRRARVGRSPIRCFSDRGLELVAVGSAVRVRRARSRGRWDATANGKQPQMPAGRSFQRPSSPGWDRRAVARGGRGLSGPDQASWSSRPGASGPAGPKRCSSRSFVISTDPVEPEVGFLSPGPFVGRDPPVSEYRPRQ